MKLNWGTGILIAFALFIGFILFFVVRMSTDHRASHDLVTEDYYRAELDYQKEIDAENNARGHGLRLTVSKTKEGFLVIFPDIPEPQHIKGTVSLYRPSDKHLDFDFPLSLSNSHLLIPDKRLLDGRWDIKIAWEYDNEAYLHKENLIY